MARTDSVILVVCFLAAVLALNWSLCTRMPEPVTAAAPANEFSEQRALEDIRMLSSFGPRTVGSRSNEVLAVNFLADAVNKIKAAALPGHLVEVEVQRSSGNFQTTFAMGMTNAYHALNVLVRISPSDNPSSRDNALLLNAHFDTKPNSPGAGDDASGVALLLEVLRVLTQSKPLRNAIIFEFNGAEETGLMAAHGFVTQHEWVPTIRGFINVDAAGTGGPLSLFRTGPNAWLLNLYAKNALHPTGASIYDDIFSTGVIPSDTDFAVLNIIAKVPGVDMAWSANGYVYHTNKDVFDELMPGFLQHGGDNVLPMVRAFGQELDIANLAKTPSQELVYFDIAQRVMLIFPFDVIRIVGWLTVLLGLFIARSARLKIVIFMIFAIVIGLIIPISIAFISAFFGFQLNWFSQPWILAFLYAIPSAIAFVGSFSILTAGSTTVDKHSVQAASTLIGTALLGLLLFYELKSTYIFIGWVTSSALAHGISRVFRGESSHGKDQVKGWQSFQTSKSYDVIHSILSIFSFAIANLSFYWFITIVPIGGRSGTSVPFEMVIAGSIGVSVVLFLIQPLHLLSTNIRSVKSVFFVGLVVFVAAFAVNAVTFPYSARNPTAPKRLFVSHTERHLSFGNGSAFHDSGLFINPLDSQGVNAIQDILIDSHWVNTTLELGGYPWDFPQWNVLKESRFLPAAIPITAPTVTIDITEKSQVNDTCRVCFEAKGTARMSVQIAAIQGALSSWTFAEEIPPVRSDGIYFVNMAFADSRAGISTCVVLNEIKGDCREFPVIRIAASGYELVDFTQELTDFLQRLPDWVSPTPSVSSYRFVEA